jgi:hypothetical protein
MFIIAVMFLSAALSSRLHIVHEQRSTLPRPDLRRLPTDFRESCRCLLRPLPTVALAQLITSGTLVLLFSSLLRYMTDVIGAPPDSAAIVFAPVNRGAVGLRFLPWFTRVRTAWS